MRKKVFMLMVLITIALFSVNVHANKINKIEMNVYIDEDGSALIKEIWDAELKTSTEGYHVFSNLENKEIIDFKVTDENKKEYENITKWNIDASFDDKAYKSGINYTDDGLELCWGISKYGKRQYTLEYKMSNFVTQYTDKQGIYFKFIEMDQPIENARVVIYSDIPFSLDNTRIWSFGNKGEVYFEDGKIIYDSKTQLDQSQYITGLVRFSDDLFNLENISTKSFDDVYDEAFDKVVKSNSFNNVEMDVYIDKNGNGIVKETWNVDLYYGSEMSRSFENLENKKITDIKITDEIGTIYDSISNWNVQNTFENKKKCYGVTNSNDIIELHWGISEYGKRKYIIEYTINNLVGQYTDSQGFDYTFISFSERIGRVKIYVHSDTPFSTDNTNIWSFGSGKELFFENGKIVYDSKSTFYQFYYVRELIGFKEKMFKLSTSYNESIDSIHKKIVKEIKINNIKRIQCDNSYFAFYKGLLFGAIAIIIEKIYCIPLFVSITFFIVFLSSLIFAIKKVKDRSRKAYNYFLYIDAISIILIIIIINVLIGNSSESIISLLIIPFRLFFLSRLTIIGNEFMDMKLDLCHHNNLSFGNNGKLLPSVKDINYYRDIPFNKNIKYAYWIANEYKIYEDNIEKGIIGAYLLKWINSGDIKAFTSNKESKEEYYIDFSKDVTYADAIENNLYHIIRSAAGDNYLLEANEFKTWSKKNYFNVYLVLSDIYREIITDFEKKGLIKLKEKKGILFRGEAVREIDNSVKEDAIKLKGFKKFLDDFSMIGLKEPIEVHLWGDYLVFAELLGIADKVRKSFAELYPSLNVNLETNIDRSYDSIFTIVDSFATSYEKGSIIGYDRDHPSYSDSGGHDYSGSSSSSGGGGSSSSSGGSSAGGSSGGGFR